MTTAFVWCLDYFKKYSRTSFFGVFLFKTIKNKISSHLFFTRKLCGKIPSEGWRKYQSFLEVFLNTFQGETNWETCHDLSWGCCLTFSLWTSKCPLFSKWECIVSRDRCEFHSRREFCLYLYCARRHFQFNHYFHLRPFSLPFSSSSFIELYWFFFYTTSTLPLCHYKTHH